MKILLTMPHPHAKYGLFSRFTYPSLTLKQLAAITPLEHDLTVIDERYEIKEKIGQGGFGAVYRAFDKKMHVEKALKVIQKLRLIFEKNVYSFQLVSLHRIFYPNILVFFL